MTLQSEANVKPTSRHTFHTLLGGNAALATGHNIGSLSACR